MYMCAKVSFCSTVTCYQVVFMSVFLQNLLKCQCLEFKSLAIFKIKRIYKCLCFYSATNSRTEGKLLCFWAHDMCRFQTGSPLSHQCVAVCPHEHLAAAWNGITVQSGQIIITTSIFRQSEKFYHLRHYNIMLGLKYV